MDVDGTIIFWRIKERLYGIMCTHMDDLCFGGNEMFHRMVISHLKENLKVGVEESTQFKYLGINVVDREDNWIIMEQNEYILEKLRSSLVLQGKHEKELNLREQKSYRSIIGQLNWLAQNTRPDLCSALSNLGRKLVKAVT